MKVKVSEATGPVLDWMVWEIAGGPAAYPKMVGKAFLRAWNGNSAKYLHPSTDWSQGGPIIERAEIHLLSPYSAHPIPSLAKSWLAHCPKAPHLADGWGPAKGHGPTPLIAAMRCFVSSKLGDEVDVPEELL